jgi:hypothetical protein
MRISAADVLSVPGVFLLTSTADEVGCPFSGLLSGYPTDILSVERRRGWGDVVLQRGLRRLPRKFLLLVQQKPHLHLIRVPPLHSTMKDRSQW